MPSQPRPKVLLFDIGGVVVVSPFQAILDYELSLGIPPGWVNYSISKTAPDGFWHKLERGDIPLDDAYFAGFNADLSDQGRWHDFYKLQQAKNPSLPETVPDLPQLDGRWLFYEMMTKSKATDPWMWPALQRLAESGLFVLAAMSNTVIFPEGDPLHEADFFDNPVRRLFDVFVSSAHVGLRKPKPEIYQYTLQAVQKFARDNAQTERGRALGWADGIRPEDVLFLDDIGENLKGGKKAGFRTLKVSLGRTYEAVDGLEEATGLKLAGDHPRIPVEPTITKSSPKL
ncbi:glucose-1-phosphatase [Microdochium nivale]|nr:glucose-1-phosphatase [Microdochium nivale]